MVTLHNINYNGISVLIGAIAAAIPLIGGFILQVITFIDQRHLKMLAATQAIDAVRREGKLDSIAKQVNGVTENAVNLAYRTGRAEEKSGAPVVPPTKSVSSTSEQTEPQE